MGAPEIGAEFQTMSPCAHVPPAGMVDAERHALRSSEFTGELRSVIQSVAFAADTLKRFVTFTAWASEHVSFVPLTEVRTPLSSVLTSSMAPNTGAVIVTSPPASRITPDEFVFEGDLNAGKFKVTGMSALTPSVPNPISSGPSRTTRPLRYGPPARVDFLVRRHDAPPVITGAIMWRLKPSSRSILIPA